MQFVKGGPDVPERLIQAHEEGKVVFFCGAGISYPAGLPGFGGLVRRLYAAIGEEPKPLEAATLKANQYDTTIGLLEARLAPSGKGREMVRRAIAEILTPPKLGDRETQTHSALLSLARCRSGRTRLVTTNFDRLFDHVIERDGLSVERFLAPLLPVPKSRWDGIVHLHGLLTQKLSVSDLDRLVLSSGDFGLAYLTERWASRFVSEMFRNYTVCFIGYSINDPVLRYMMDALAADRLLGESPPEMFAFGSYSKNKYADREAEWCAKNVTPILYREHLRHTYLHRTLSAWAATYRDGVDGKEQIVLRHSGLQPQHSTTQENFVGRVLWALSDRTGLPARRFVDMTPAPVFDWVHALLDRRFERDDLVRFGVVPLPIDDELRELEALGSKEKLTFSLLNRPSPYLRAPYMSIVHWGHREPRLDDVMQHLARWLLRYLDEPKLILWLAKQGGVLHGYFARLLENQIDNISKWEREGAITELSDLRRRSPQAIPRPVLRSLWRLVLTGRVLATSASVGLYQWFDRFERDGMTASLRQELRVLLTPHVRLREPFKWPDPEQHEGRLKALVDWELVLASDHVHSALSVHSTLRWQQSLPALIDDLWLLLRDALDLMAELGSADADSDLSYIAQPSISEHPQNRDFNEWTALIDLTRDAWLAIADVNPTKAIRVASQWMEVDYPLFKRLAFFAATHGAVVAPGEALDWLLARDGWWLWSVETEREAIRLLVVLAPRLNEVQAGRLQEAIQAGPPRIMFKEDVTDERLDEIAQREIWLRLSKMRSGGLDLNRTSATMLRQIEADHPEWHLEADGRDEFPYWMGDGAELRAVEASPRRRRELAQWLRDNPNDDMWREDDWAERCRKNFSTTSSALMALANEGFWPAPRWRTALQAWSDEELKRRAWKHMAPVLANAPDEVIVEVAHSLSNWLQRVAGSFEVYEDVFFALCERILSLLSAGEIAATNEPVTDAINHPIGHIAQALVDWWYRHELRNDAGLPIRISTIFSSLCQTEVPLFRHGRVILAAHSINLFLVDPAWTRRHLLPHFEWKRSISEAKAAWEGFLWSPRLVRSHLAAIKSTLLETAGHYSALGRHGDQYASLLTYVALDRGETFTIDELRRAFRALPLAGLAAAANALARALDGAGEQREAYWTNRIAPFWKEVWPKSNAVSAAIADDLFKLCLGTGAQFPSCLATLRAWLVPVPGADYLVRLLQKSELIKRYPEDALEWLNLLIDAQPWAPRELKHCLDEVVRVREALVNDPRYVRLDQFWRRHNH